MAEDRRAKGSTTGAAPEAPLAPEVPLELVEDDPPVTLTVTLRLSREILDDSPLMPDWTACM